MEKIIYLKPTELVVGKKYYVDAERDVTATFKGILDGNAVFAEDKIKHRLSCYW